MAACNFADFWIVFGTIIAVIAMLFIDEWSVFPLTKSAKAAQEKRKQESENKDKPAEESEKIEVQSENEKKDGESNEDE